MSHGWFTCECGNYYHETQHHSGDCPLCLKEEKEMEEELDFERNYSLEIGDVVLIQKSGHGFVKIDVDKYVEITGYGNYFGEPGLTVKEYDKPIKTIDYGTNESVVGYGSFGSKPMILLNTLEENATEESEDDFSFSHYDNYYTLTENDIKQGKIKVDAYWVAKQWKTGSRDDSGALWHSLKTIARFGDKNSKEREIKALYSQAKALARIYGVVLDD